MTAEIERCIEEYKRNKHHLISFAESIRNFFAQHPALSSGATPVLHSIRMRLKDDDHLRDKLRRKSESGQPVESVDLLKKVNDLAGIRLLHIYQAQFGQIHGVIVDQLSRRDWVLHEPPVAYTWDPESKAFFEKLGLRTEVKESFYTSIHFVLKPRDDSQICCELQVRTLFEEIWGEVDHWINYPHRTSSVSCGEQIRVLSRLVGAGSRLTDSIFRAYDEYLAQVAVSPLSVAKVDVLVEPPVSGVAGALVEAAPNGVDVERAVELSIVDVTPADVVSSGKSLEDDASLGK